MYLRDSIDDKDSAPIDTVHNYYERLVLNEIYERYHLQFENEDILADMACIALNQIPPRYIRYDIDMSFYMSPNDHDEVEKRVKDAADFAHQKIIESEKLLNQEKA